jgi:hypothetical protein
MTHPSNINTNISDQQKALLASVASGHIDLQALYKQHILN